MKQYIYSIFQTCDKNGCSDLNIALAMLLADARSGIRCYGPEELDYAALKADYSQLEQEEGELRCFMGRHYDRLVKAYQTADEGAFRSLVKKLEEQEARAAEAVSAPSAGEQQ